MTANKHTPGPWKAVEPAAIDWRDPFVQTADGESTVALTCGGGPGVAITAPAQRANARLIASAPELLEALIEGRRAIGDHDAPNDCYATGPMTGNHYRDLVECPACSFIAMYDAAIAKATGGAA